MSPEKLTPEPIESQPKESETFSPTLDGFLEAIQQEGVDTLPVEMIREQLADTGEAIVTRDYNCGIRIFRTGSRLSGGYKYTIFI